MLWKIILSAILLSLSFPNFNLGFLAYAAFVPLFSALKGVTKKRAFLFSYMLGLIFFGITIHWLRYVSIPGYIFLVSILSLLFGLFGIFSRYSLLATRYSLLTVPSFWVILEYIRTNAFTGFGWALLGHSQYLILPVIQIADMTGAYGVSFLVMAANVMIYDVVSAGIRESKLIIFMSLFLFSATITYGVIKLNGAEEAGKRLNISLVQGNIPQAMKWDEEYRTYIMDTYIRLTRDASADRPQLIIWPETALPGFMEEETLSDKIRGLAKDINAYLLIGAPSFDYNREVMFNSAFLASPEGEVAGRYNKLHLVPFGEYIPLKRHINFIRDYIDKPIGDFARGREYTVFELKDGARFGTLICFEDIFPNLVRRFAADGADFMVNITNDAWFMKTAAPYQHAQSSVFRAIENRIPVVRAANTGLSCFIDKFGRITDTVRAGKDEIFVSGYKTKEIALSRARSFYNKFGDIFVLFCAIMAGRRIMGKKISLILVCLALMGIFAHKAAADLDKEVAAFISRLEETVGKMDTYSFIMESENWKGAKHEKKVIRFRFKKPNLMRTDVLEGDKKGSAVVLRKDGRIIGRNSLGFKKTMKPTDERLKNIRGYTFMQTSLSDKIGRIKRCIFEKGCTATLKTEEYMNKPVYRLHISHKGTDDDVTDEDIWFDRDKYTILKVIKFEGKDKASNVTWREHSINIPLDDSIFNL